MKTREFAAIAILAMLVCAKPLSAQETNNIVFWGLFDEQVQNDVSKIDAYTSVLGKKPAIIMWYTGWNATGDFSFPKAKCTTLWEAGYLPDVTWEPWLGVDAILSGDYDDELIQYGKDIADYGYPVMLRWGHEFNGDWYPWSVDASGKLVPASKYVEAYQHVHDLVVGAGASNALWVWCPNNSTSSSNGQSLASYYPGDDYVDWLGIDGYNWGNTQSWSSWTSFKNVFSSMYQALVSAYPDKPIIIGEYGCANTGGDKPSWITDHFTSIKNDFPNIKAIVWFNINKETDWRFNSTTESTAAFKAGLADDVFSGDHIKAAGYVFGNVDIELEGEVAPGQSAVVFRLSNSNSNWSYNWTVDGSALIVGENTLDSVIVDFGCTHATINCSVESNTGVLELSKTVELSEYFIKAPLFVDENEAGVSLSTAYSSGAQYTWTLPDGVSFSGSPDSCVVYADWGTKTDTVKLEIQNTCGSFYAEALLFITGQYAYPNPARPHALPGTIEATEYNYGGEGLAYHDADPENQGNGSRSDEGVDTEPNDMGENIGWINAGEWVNYTVVITDPGQYFVEARIASQSGGGQFSILMNGEERISNISVPSTGGWSTFSSIYPGYIDLYESDTLLRYSFTNSGFNMGRMILWEPDSEVPTKPGSLTAVPARTSLKLSWNKASDNQKVLGYRIYIDGIFYQQVSDSICTVSNLEPDTEYLAGVSAIDIQGNESDTLEASFTTLLTGITNTQAVKPELYPNPLPKGEWLTIKINEAAYSGKVLVELSDLTGKEVYRASMNGSELHVSPEAFSQEGIYLLQLKSGEAVYSGLVFVH